MVVYIRAGVRQAASGRAGRQEQRGRDVERNTPSWPN